MLARELLKNTIAAVALIVAVLAIGDALHHPTPSRETLRNGDGHEVKANPYLNTAVTSPVWSHSGINHILVNA